MFQISFTFPYIFANKIWYTNDSVFKESVIHSVYCLRLFLIYCLSLPLYFLLISHYSQRSNYRFSCYF